MKKALVFSRGEPWIWLAGGGLGLALLMIFWLLLVVAVEGFSTFWPQPVQRLVLSEQRAVLGVVTREEFYTREQGGEAFRQLVRVGNFDIYGEDFQWVSDFEKVSSDLPSDVWYLERQEWGPWIGWIEPNFKDDFRQALLLATERKKQIAVLEKKQLGEINSQLEQIRLEIEKAKHQQQPFEEWTLQTKQLQTEYEELQKKVQELKAVDQQVQVVLREVGGRTKTIPLSEVVRAFQPNALAWTGKLQIYLERWSEFLTDEPREANTEGGIWPAIFGTLMMTVIMSLFVAPFGVVAALYLKEYAKQGFLVSATRIAVNNLAGVPSIVFGVFGLGFFCYFLGGTIDSIFFQEKLPSPTFGTGGILWASLTLALLTVPVVIVATEEALSAVPRSLREASYACGASRWQTIRRVVLPRASGGILTGLILAMARGAGEVAPLMLTGVVKLAPDLPIDGHFPYFHLERSFMHLGFHIYDVGFQSRNAEAGKPMVFTTTLLLIAMVILLNITAIQLRKRLRQRYASSKF